MPVAARFLPDRVFYGWYVAVACGLMMWVTVGVGYYGLATFLRAQGYPTGDSLVEQDWVDRCRSALDEFGKSALGVFQVDSATALSLTVVAHAVQLLVILSLGAWALWREGLNVRTLERVTAEVE